MRTACGQKFSSIRRCLLKLLLTKTPKWPQIGPEPKHWSGFFWVKLKTMIMQKVEFDIQKAYMDGPIRGYVRICDDPLTHGGNLDHIWALEMFFGLILQEFCDFSGTLDLHY